MCTFGLSGCRVKPRRLRAGRVVGGSGGGRVGWWAGRAVGWSGGGHGGTLEGGPEGVGARRGGDPKGLGPEGEGGPKGRGARRGGGPKGWGPEGVGARTQKSGARRVGGLRVGARRVGGPKFHSFRSLFRLHFHSFCPLGGLLVEIWRCFQAPGPSNVCVWALGLSCEAPAALSRPQAPLTPECGQTRLAKCGHGQIRFGQMRSNKDGQIRFDQVRSRPPLSPPHTPSPPRSSVIWSVFL